MKREGLDAFERIGEDVREVLERRPASTVAVRLSYPKFVRKDRAEGAPTPVLVAEPAELPIPRGTAGPAMLADTLVRRWADHQPLNRLEGIYAREGLELAKSTMSTWHDQLRELAEPLVDAMFTDAKSAPYLCVDATGVLVQAPERCKHGHFWVMVAPGKHVLYKFSHRHDSDAVDALLAGYAGYLVADAHAVYDHLYATGAVVEVGCWCHGRRYFFKALESDPELRRGVHRRCHQQGADRRSVGLRDGRTRTPVRRGPAPLHERSQGHTLVLLVSLSLHRGRRHRALQMQQRLLSESRRCKHRQGTYSGV